MNTTMLTGRDTSLAGIRILPAGWVEVQRWNRWGDEKTYDQYAGPLLTEEPGRVTLEIAGEPMEFFLGHRPYGDWAIVRRSDDGKARLDTVLDLAGWALIASIVFIYVMAVLP